MYSLFPGMHWIFLFSLGSLAVDAGQGQPQHTCNRIQTINWKTLCLVKRLEARGDQHLENVQQTGSQAPQAPHSTPMAPQQHIVCFRFRGPRANSERSPSLVPALLLQVQPAQRCQPA